ncbi:MFS transporter [Erwinia typographi]|uniref:MFS transporter n=1 Tax=Erwinia typographi TaxID=371042 RepID=A0A0A3ZAK9_9GAMM|nr:MFS transporter [Erwinia typographi]KGT96092.1 MFS transporter [Erwinia typographi]
MAQTDSSIRSSAVSSSGYFLFVLLITAANLRTPIAATGPILDNICQTFGLNPSQAGLLNFIPLLMFAVLAPVSAALGNRFGLERTLWCALWLITLGSVLRISDGETGLWLGTWVLSSGIAAANVLLPPLIKRDFREHTAKYIGLYATTMAISAGLASGVAVPLAEMTQAGWTLSLGVWLLPAGIALLAWLPPLKNHAQPQHASQKASAARLKNPWGSLLGWQVSLFMALQSMAFYTLITWFTPYAQANGFSQQAAGWLLFVYQIVAVASNFACMAALKRLPDQRLLGFVCSLAIFIGLAGLWLAPHFAALWLIIAGCGAGASMVTCLTLFNLRAADHRQASQLSGMAQCVGYALAALGPLFFGVLHEHSAGWTLPLGVLTAMSLLQTIVAPLAGRKAQIG